MGIILDEVVWYLPVSSFEMICGGGSRIIVFVCWRRFILLSLFGIIKLFDPPFQVHPYVLPPCLLENFAASWCLGALLFHASPSCAHFLCVQQYFLTNYVKGLWGCPYLGSVAAWRVRVFWLIFFSPPPFWFVFIWISSWCICCMLFSIWGRVVDTYVATLATGVGWTVVTIVGSGFSVGLHSGSWGG